jgi:hypothetical protein
MDIPGFITISVVAGNEIDIKTYNTSGVLADLIVNFSLILG